MYVYIYIATFAQQREENHARPFVGASHGRSWSHFVGIYRQKLTRSLKN